MPRGGTQPIRSATKKTTFGSRIRDDFLMDIGEKEKTPEYRSRLAERTRRSREAMKNLKTNKGNKTKRKTARMVLDEERAAKLAKERVEGQKKRKAFEKKQGEKYARRRRLLLNI